MKCNENVTIAVTGGWDDWHSASARFADLHDVHWLQPKGAPQPLIHAYALCGHLTNGHLPHQCDGSPAHLVRVCVLKGRNIPEVYAELVRKANERGVVLSLSPHGAATARHRLPASSAWHYPA